MQENLKIAENRYRQKILLNPNDNIGKTILEKGVYDQTGLYFIEKILSRLHKPTIFDVGANIGNHALCMTQYASNIYLFEPQTEIADNLNTTATLNNITNWNVLNIGLSDEENTLTFYKNLDSNIESSFVSELKGDNFQTIEAKVCVGDNIIQQYTINQLDFMKIDVEGFEAKVILGLKNSITKFRPIIFMEWDKQITKDQFRELQLFEQIFSNYHIKAIIRNPNESSLYKKIREKIRRVFSVNLSRKRWLIGEFLPQLNYRHIILVPIEKSYVLDGL